MSRQSQSPRDSLLRSFDRLGLELDTSKNPINTEGVEEKMIAFSYVKINLEDLLPRHIVEREEGRPSIFQ